MKRPRHGKWKQRSWRRERNRVLAMYCVASRGGIKWSPAWAAYTESVRRWTAFKEAWFRSRRSQAC